jgi:hypothetical protein
MTHVSEIHWSIQTFTKIFKQTTFKQKLMDEYCIVSPELRHIYLRFPEESNSRDNMITMQVEELFFNLMEPFKYQFHSNDDRVKAIFWLGYWR